MIQLNKQQQVVVDAAINHYWNSSEQTFQYTGEAGTGKSVVMNEIRSHLKLKDEEILAMAYTGQAASVMRSKGMYNAVTCHSGLFDFFNETIVDPVTGIPKMDIQFNIPLTRMVMKPKNLKSMGYKAIFIDEGWMVPKSFRKYIDNTGIKTFVAGDPRQLPPINDNPGYFIDGKIYRLTELMRQSELSPIIYLAHRAMNKQSIDIGFYGDVWVCYKDEITDDILNKAHMVLCGKRKTREELNKHIRTDIRHIYRDSPIYGERMICKKNNWNKIVDGIALTNGLVGTVIRPCEVSNFNKNTNTYKIDFLPDLLSTPYIQLECDFKYLNADINLKDKLKNNRFSKGEKMEYAYASTTHSAQGSEYLDGIYFEEYLNPSIQSNLNYTGITRFKRRLIYVKDRPKFYF